MIRWFFKYSALIFLLNTILLSIEPTMEIGYNIFLIIMSIALFLLLINPRQVKNWLGVLENNFGNAELSEVFIPSFDCRWSFASSSHK